jgi:hypothetical protein
MRLGLKSLTLVLASTLAGCGASQSDSSVAVSAAVRSGTAKLSSIPTGSGTVKFENLYLVVKEVELQKAPTLPAGSSAPASPTASSSDSDDADDLEEIETGPYVIEVAVTDTGLQAAIPSSVVPAGAYKGIEFEIHRVRSTDPLNIQTTKRGASLDGRSIVLEGTCTAPATGTPATSPDPTPFALSSTMEVEVEYESPIVIPEGASYNVSLVFDASTWLTGPDGSTLDPCLGDPDVNARIMANVKASLKAFGDDDRDGEDDED